MLARTDTTARDVARLVAGGATLLNLSVCLDSAMEHYRGSFQNPAMVLPVAASAVGLGADGARIGGGVVRGVVRGAAHGTAGAIGMAGFGLHAWNILKRPSGITFTNLFYGAPLGAPGALVLAAALGAVSDALLCAFGILGTVGEAGLLHLKGAYQNPFMVVPVTLSPVAAASLAIDAATGAAKPWTRALLGLTAAMGIAGVAFHAYGVGRNMGGWRNWRQNLLSGPPLPAPPSFTGLAVAGLGALKLMRPK